MLMEKFEKKAMVCDKHNKILNEITTSEKQHVYICTQCEFERTGRSE